MTSQALFIPAQARRPLRAVCVMALGLALVIGQPAAVMARAAPESFADLAEQISTSVVNITTSSTVAAAIDDGAPGPQVPPGSPFEDFFRDFMDRQENGEGGQPRRSEALGSGFVISSDGFIVTNNHVIEGADEIKIEFYSGEMLPAKLVGTDPKTDIALLKVDSPEPLDFVTFGDSDVMRVGDWVVAMGNPLGQGFSVSAGIVSARNRALSGAYDDYLQTDAAINRGNSGGPLFNTDGQVIGVNTAILSPNGGSIGIGFSMASNVVSQVVDQLKEFGETRRGWLGVRIQDVTPDVAEAIGLADAAGALVTDVPEGPAADAGILSGDVIVSFDGVVVADTRELVRRVGNTEVGKAVPLMVFRDGAEKALEITLGRRELAENDPVPASVAKPETAEKQMFGLTLKVLTEEMRAEMGLAPTDTGLVITAVDETTEAFEKGLRPGDLITEAGQQKVAAIADLDARIADAKGAGRKSLLLLIRREGEPRFVAITIE